MAEDPVGIAGTGVSVQQVEGMAAGLDKAASAVAEALSPTAKLVDLAGSAAGLPDPLKQVAKIAVGAGTGDVMGVVSGAFGIAADLMEAIAATQYRPQGGGYAPSSVSDLLRERQALQTLLREFDAIDTAGGLWFRDGKFSGLDMNAVMKGDFPPELRQAVRYFQEHPERYCGMDRSDGFDGLVTRGGLQQELCRVSALIDAPAQGCQALSKLGAARGEVAQLMGHPAGEQLLKAQERVSALCALISEMSESDGGDPKHALQNQR